MLLPFTDNWQWEATPFTKLDFGKWELKIPARDDGSCAIQHLSEIKVIVRNQSGQLLDRLSPWAKYVQQPPKHLNQGSNYKQRVWQPPAHEVIIFVLSSQLFLATQYGIFDHIICSNSQKSLNLANQLLFPPKNKQKYIFKHRKPDRPKSLKIYESHVGIATQNFEVGTYQNFSANILPRIVRQGYNAIQVMAVMEHAYYASFGYQVTSFYAGK